MCVCVCVFVCVCVCVCVCIGVFVILNVYFPLSIPVICKPKIHFLGSGSDFAPFMDNLGIPSVDFIYSFDPKSKLSSSPV